MNSYTDVAAGCSSGPVGYVGGGFNGCNMTSPQYCSQPELKMEMVSPLSSNTDVSLANATPSQISSEAKKTTATLNRSDNSMAKLTHKALPQQPADSLPASKASIPDCPNPKRRVCAVALTNLNSSRLMPLKTEADAASTQPETAAKKSKDSMAKDTCKGSGIAAFSYLN